MRLSKIYIFFALFVYSLSAQGASLLKSRAPQSCSIQLSKVEAVFYENVQKAGRVVRAETAYEGNFDNSLPDNLVLKITYKSSCDLQNLDWEIKSLSTPDQTSSAFIRSLNVQKIRSSVRPSPEDQHLYVRDFSLLKIYKKYTQENWPWKVKFQVSVSYNQKSSQSSSIAYSTPHLP